MCLEEVINYVAILTNDTPKSKRPNREIIVTGCAPYWKFENSPITSAHIDNSSRLITDAKKKWYFVISISITTRKM